MQHNDQIVPSMAKSFIFGASCVHQVQLMVNVLVFREDVLRDVDRICVFIKKYQVPFFHRFLVDSEYLFLFCDFILSDPQTIPRKIHH